MKKHIITLGLILSFVGFLKAQQVENITFVIEGNNIVVKYNVYGVKYDQSLNTSLFVSTDGGKTYQGPLKLVSGDVGPGILNGSHQIVWESIQEIPLNNNYIAFEVRAEVIQNKNPKSFYVALSGNLTTPLGFRAGLLGKTGLYASIQTNTSPGITGSYTYFDNSLTDYDQFAWYEFTSAHKEAAWTACLGATSQISRNFFIYAGAGYGKYELLYEINEYSYENDALLGSDYGIDKEASASGLAVEAGFIYRFKKLLILGGASSLQFKNLNWVAGLGFSF